MKSLKDLSIAIITGGWSAEREENLTGASAVKKTLLENGVSPIYIEIKRGVDFIPKLYKHQIDFALLCMTEEVPIQGILDVMGVPYSGSGAFPTMLCMDKKKTKELMDLYGIYTPTFKTLTRKDLVDKKTNLYSGLKLPVVVKPNNCGSSVGVSLVRETSDSKRTINLALKHSDEVIVEKYIKGRELTISVLGRKIFPPVEVISPSGIYDEEAKKNFGAEYKALLRVDKRMRLAINKTIEKLRDIFHLQNIWRLDTIWADEKLYVLEINTLPYLGSPFGVMATSFQSVGLNHYVFLQNIINEKLKEFSRTNEH